MGHVKNPVVLVHGWLDKQHVFNKMQRYLKQHGWTVYSLDLIPSDGRKPLPELAEQLEAFIAAKLAPSQKFDLLGFSMGGLVTRYYLQRMGGNQRVERYINISAPNNGTLTAKPLSGVLPGIKQMRPDSDFLKDLNSDLTVCLANIRVTWLWTPYDLIIMPPRSTCLPIGREVKLPVAFHPWMLTDNRSLVAVKEALSEV